MCSLSLGNLLSNVLLITALMESQRFAMNITPGIRGQKTLLYFVYANMYFPFSSGFAWGVGVRTETHLDSMNKQFILREGEGLPGRCNA